MHLLRAGCDQCWEKIKWVSCDGNWVFEVLPTHGADFGGDHVDAVFAGDAVAAGFDDDGRGSAQANDAVVLFKDANAHHF